MTLKQLFVACVGLGFGSAFAAWVIREVVVVVNAFAIVAYNTFMQKRMSGVYVPCVKCAERCNTLLQCTSPTCGWVHAPLVEGKPTATD
jgi:hypothetical protein